MEIEDNNVNDFWRKPSDDDGNNRNDVPKI